MHGYSEKEAEGLLSKQLKLRVKLVKIIVNFMKKGSTRCRNRH